MRTELRYKMDLTRTLTKLGEIKAFKHYALGNKDLAGLFAGNKSQILLFLPRLGMDSWVCVSPQSTDTVHVYTDPHSVWTHSCLTAATPAKPIPSISEASRNTATLQLPAAEGTGINQRETGKPAELRPLLPAQAGERNVRERAQGRTNTRHESSLPHSQGRQR